jgi:intein-encoded DNA endonuclease-like protein
MKVFAYIKGVMDGDGYVDNANVNPKLALDVKDKWFAEKFKKALHKIGLSPYINERDRIRENFNGYTFKSHHYITRATCSQELIDKIKDIEIDTKEEIISYLQGFYDSEGYYDRKRKCFTIREKNKLPMIKILLEKIGCKSHLYDYKHQTTPELHMWGKDAILFKELIEVK